MLRYFSRQTIDTTQSSKKNEGKSIDEEAAKRVCLEFNPASIISDPAARKPISYYHPNIQDEVRRAYLQSGPCQPREHEFKMKLYGEKRKPRRFLPTWFDEYPTWLEYSTTKEAAFCLYCFVFQPENRKHSGFTDGFVVDGFNNWKKKEKLRDHVGGFDSDHNKAQRSCDTLMNQEQHVETFLNRQSDKTRNDYRIRLTASIDCTRYLLQQGLAFRGRDETIDSINQGNFLELLKFLSDHNDDIKRVCLDNSPGNLKMTSSDIQKDIVKACALETTKAITKGLEGVMFSILVDEARDMSNKEQMAVVLRYVDKYGHVIECFVGIIHVPDTTALSLKVSIQALLLNHQLSLSNIRGQGYDGASNMRGEFNGLKALILKEYPCAFYVHCFAHQLQLALVGVAKNHVAIESFFGLATNVVNVVGGSSKRHDILLSSQATKIVKDLENGELESGRGQNQEKTVKRAGDTRWGSHYVMLSRLTSMFPAIIDVLDLVGDSSKFEQRIEARSLLDALQSFDFIFCLHLMLKILGYSNELSQALQRKDQDIVNAMQLVKIAKFRLQTLRDNGWSSLLEEVSSFCRKNLVEVPHMDEMLVIKGKSRRKARTVTNIHYYRVELFYGVIDLQLQELNNRFDEVNTELLLCVSCLSPNDSFAAFDKDKLVQMAQLYKFDFSAAQLIELDNQLETYIIDVRENVEFVQLKGISSLAEKMVKTKKNVLYPLVYKLITLALILPVSTATVERAFSAMKIVNNRLRNRMSDDWMSDILITYIEKDILMEVSNKTIIQQFQKMKSRRIQL